MSGICGTYGKEDLGLIRKMTDIMVHRGPDDWGTYSDEGVALGHRQLAIGPNAGHEPVQNEDGTVWAVLDGAIHNHKELREELNGHHFLTFSATEVLVHLYQVDPDHFLEKVNGTFALALWDSGRKRLILARDPLGNKPLYYCQEGGVLYFASEIKALLAAGVEKRVDEEMIDCYLGYHFGLGDRTLFRGIRKLMAGHVLTADQQGISIRQYWDIVPEPATTTDLAASEHLRRLLEISCEHRVMGEPPIGAFLSGGIDSSAVAALTKPYAGRDFHTVSVGFPAGRELELARTVSDHLGTIHHELIIEPEMVAKHLEKIAFHYDEPLGDPDIVRDHFLSLEARKYVKAAVAGGGGDELFAGHPNYAQNLKFEETRHKMYGGLAKSLMGMYPQRGNIFRNLREKEMSTFESDSIEEMMLRSIRELNDNEIKWLRGKAPSDSEAMAVMPHGIKYRLDRMLYIDCKNRLAELRLMQADKAAMANSIEERMPLVDKAIAEFAFTLPPALKINAGEGSFILRLAVKDLLPPEIVKHKDTGPSTPMADWMRHEVGEMALSEMDSSEFLKSHFETRRLQRIGKELSARNGKASCKIWTVYALGLWHRTFFG
jgi:asparagine synthase (glutamine-hydrolysing)